MSDLPGNPHEEDAMMYSCEASEIQAHEDHERPILAQQATTHATLALAYEQRTANLIAYVETFGGGIEYETIWADIRARLGLGENNE